MTTDRKAQANKANAQRSTGPRTAQGKRSSSQNAVRHGLNVLLGPTLLTPLTRELIKLIEQDGIDEAFAAELATRIMDYERNQAHQRTLAGELQEAQQELSDDERQAQLEQEWPDMEILDDVLLELTMLNGAPSAKDLKDVARLKERMARWSEKDRTKRQALLAKQEQASRRYLKRSSNQLIKGLKALGRVQ